MVVHKFKISDRLFQGFEIDLDLDYYDSVEEICKQVKVYLSYFSYYYSCSFLW